MVLLLVSVEGPAEIAALSAARGIFVVSAVPDDAPLVHSGGVGGPRGPLDHGVDLPYTPVDPKMRRRVRASVRGAAMVDL